MAHGSWVVQHCITHGPQDGKSIVWPMGHGDFVTMYGPWVMGKKSLKGLELDTSNHNHCLPGGFEGGGVRRTL